jgi:hypothetical protein
MRLWINRPTYIFLFLFLNIYFLKFLGPGWGANLGSFLFFEIFLKKVAQAGERTWDLFDFFYFFIPSFYR